MKKLLCLIPVLALLVFLPACENDEKKTLSEGEIRYNDSISKIQQSVKADSLKRKDPLLIIPPDSNYTGDYVDKYPSGITKFKGNFRFGERHGQWMSFYPNGLAWSELHYDKGLRHGPNIAYFEDGKVRYSGFYKMDRKDSVWCYYDSLGKIVEKVMFKNDRYVKDLLAK